MKYEERRLGRQLAVQCLFGLDFTCNDWKTAFDAICEMEPERLCANSIGDDEEPVYYSKPDKGVRTKAAREYARRLLGGVDEVFKALDERIVGALENWNPDRVGRVEWTILRIALFEMFHMDDVPATVAINEAINLAKTFGAEESPRFINGVLDRLRKTKGEAVSGGAADGEGLQGEESAVDAAVTVVEEEIPESTENVEER